MPSITKKHNKNSFSFKITVSCGYDEAYRKKRHYKVWKAPEGWSEQRAEREAQRIAFEFEKAIKQGYQPDNRKTFAEYAAYVIDLKEHTGTKHSTIQLYLHLCERILPAIGHIKLTELRPNHLNKLYISLQEDCTKHTMDNARAKVDLGVLIKERKWSRAKVARLAHLNGVTITTACRWPGDSQDLCGCDRCRAETADGEAVRYYPQYRSPCGENRAAASSLYLNGIVAGGERNARSV